jgi:NADH-quinone oxidoreductase subunit L
MRRMGGLRKIIPWTFATFLVGTLAIAGIPPLAGFFSKDAILAGALGRHGNVFFVVGLLTALLTAFYMARLLFMTFFGEYRGSEHHPHESPWSMLLPLVILAVGSAVGGFVNIPHFVDPVFRLAAHAEAHHVWLPWLATFTAVAGMAAAYYFYLVYPEVPGRIAGAAQPLYRLLERKYGFDDLYNWIVRRGVVGGSRAALWQGLDVAVIDGAVNGTGGAFRSLARGARTMQTGLVRGYALVMLGGAVALVTYLLWAA